MLRVFTIIPMSVALFCIFGCGADEIVQAPLEGLNAAEGPPVDDPQSADNASLTQPEEPDGGGGLSPEVHSSTVTDMIASEANTEAFDAAVDDVPLDCDTYDDTHLYQQNVESFADYEIKSMCDYRGRTLLIVNTASQCGLTPQYEGLQALNERYETSGLTILGFLSNDFGTQAGSTEQIETCNSNYRVSFEQFTPVGVLSNSRNGQHPIFAWLTSQEGLEGEVDWNFAKFLVSADGELLARWPSFESPLSDSITSAIESAINAERGAE